MNIYNCIVDATTLQVKQRSLDLFFSQEDQKHIETQNRRTLASPQWWRGQEVRKVMSVIGSLEELAKCTTAFQGTVCRPHNLVFNKAFKT